MSEAARIQDIDHGFTRLMKRMKKAAKESGGAEVGVFGNSERLVRSIADKATGNVFLAAIHEFGSPERGIPERSFLRSTADANQFKYLELLKKGHERVLEGQMDTKRALGLVGEIGVADVKARITSQQGFAPLAESTIKAKGSSKALIDTGQLLNSVTCRVVEAKEAKQ